MDVSHTKEEQMEKIQTLVKQLKELRADGYCYKHTCYAEEGVCSKCKDNFPAHLRSKSEVIKGSDRWKAYKILGWLK